MYGFVSRNKYIERNIFNLVVMYGYLFLHQWPMNSPKELSRNLWKYIFSSILKLYSRLLSQKEQPSPRGVLTINLTFHPILLIQMNTGIEEIQGVNIFPHSILLGFRSMKWKIQWVVCIVLLIVMVMFFNYLILEEVG